MKYLFVMAILVWAAVAGHIAAGDWEGNTPPPDRSMDEVREVVAGVRTSIQEVYEVLLVTEAAAAGDVTVKFEITPAGTVTDVEITCTEGLETLIEPVTETVKSLDFGNCPGQQENIPVTVPFSLLPPQLESE